MFVNLLACGRSPRCAAAIFALAVTLAAPVEAKLGETVSQLVKRFGKSYTTDQFQKVGRVYRFRSANVSVDVIVRENKSICETYFSDHALTAEGEPPNGIVQAVLRTNVPGRKWTEIPAAPQGADYAIRTRDSKYLATLNYTGSLPEGTVWTMTVQLKAYDDALRRARSSQAFPKTDSEPNDEMGRGVSKNAAERAQMLKKWMAKDLVMRDGWKIDNRPMPSSDLRVERPYHEIREVLVFRFLPATDHFTVNLYVHLLVVDAKRAFMPINDNYASEFFERATEALPAKYSIKLRDKPLPARFEKFSSDFMAEYRNFVEKGYRPVFLNADGEIEEIEPPSPTPNIL